MIFITWCRNKRHKQGTLLGSIISVEGSSEGFAGTPPTQSRLCGLPVQYNGSETQTLQGKIQYYTEPIYKDVNKAPESSLSDQKGCP